MKSIAEHRSYAFVFGHPDDEMYSTTLIKNLVELGKRVVLVYVTSGNRHGDRIGLLREAEAVKVSELLGIPKGRLYLLGITEREVKLHLQDIIKDIASILKSNNVDCVITHDHEGGHSVHDFSSFCGYTCARRQRADLWAFPAYHNQPDRRVINTFVGSRKADLRIALSADQATLKARVIDAHVTQKNYFENLPEIALSRLLKREIFRHIDGKVDYTAPPTRPVGFDFEGSPTRLVDFLTAIHTIT